MHTKSLRMLLLGVFVMCVYALPAFAGSPKMTEFFRYQDLEPAHDNRDIFVLPALSVEGKKEDQYVRGSRAQKQVVRPRADLEPRHKHVLGIEIKFVEDIQSEDLLSTIHFAGPAELVQKLQNTTQIGGMNIYIKSGIAWRVNNDLSFVVPYIRGRIAGVAVKYRSPTSWLRRQSYFYFQD